jgi:hypothetical protein
MFVSGEVVALSVTHGSRAMSMCCLFVKLCGSLV